MRDTTHFERDWLFPETEQQAAYYVIKTEVDKEFDFTYASILVGNESDSVELSLYFDDQDELTTANIVLDKLIGALQRLKAEINTQYAEDVVEQPQP